MRRKPSSEFNNSLRSRKQNLVQLDLILREQVRRGGKNLSLFHVDPSTRSSVQDDISAAEFGNALVRDKLPEPLRESD